MDNPCTRILVIGIDSGEPSLLQQMVGEKRLPHIGRMLTTGVSGSVQNPRGFESGSVWQSFHTGKLPGQHPMYDGLRYFNPQTYDFSFLQQSEIGTDLIWEHLSKRGKRCAVIDAPYCQIGQTINGIMVTDYAVHDAAHGDNDISFATHPPEVAKELLNLVGPDPSGGVQSDNRIIETLQDHLEFRDMYFARVAKKGRMISHILEKGGWDYVEAVFTEPHSVGHRLWHVANQDHEQYVPEIHAVMGDPIRELYELTDRAIGEALSQIDDRTLVLFYVSHGMQPHYTGVGLLDQALANLDRGSVTNGERTPKEILRGIWRSIPMNTRSRLRPLKKPFNGMLSPVEKEFAGNRKARRFFEVYANYQTGGIRINLQGRETHGLVATEDYEPLLETLTEEVRALVNVDTGEPLAAEVLRPRDLYDGDYVDHLPDLLVTFNRERPINQIYSESVGLVKRAFHMPRTGDHSPHGMFAAVGAGLGAHKLNSAIDAIDFFPTLCHLLDVETDSVSGTQIEQLLRFGKVPAL